MVLVWDARSGAVEHILKGHTAEVTSVAYSFDGTKIISGSNDKTICVWNAQSGTLENTLKGHADTVSSVAYSSNGLKIISGSLDKTIRIWNAQSGELEKTLEGHKAEVTYVALFFDGTKIISGSEDQTVRVWDVQSGKLENTWEGRSWKVTSVACSSDGMKIISGSWGKPLPMGDEQCEILTNIIEGGTTSIECTSVAETTIDVCDVQRTSENTLNEDESLMTSIDHSVDETRVRSDSGSDTVQAAENTVEGYSNMVTSVDLHLDDMSTVYDRIETSANPEEYPSFVNSAVEPDFNERNDQVRALIQDHRVEESKDAPVTPEDIQAFEREFNRRNVELCPAETRARGYAQYHAVEESKELEVFPRDFNQRIWPPAEIRVPEAVQDRNVEEEGVALRRPQTKSSSVAFTSVAETTIGVCDVQRTSEISLDGHDSLMTSVIGSETIQVEETTLEGYSNIVTNVDLHPDDMRTVDDSKETSANPEEYPSFVNSAVEPDFNERNDQVRALIQDHRVEESKDAPVTPEDIQAFEREFNRRNVELCPAETRARGYAQYHAVEESKELEVFPRDFNQRIWPLAEIRVPEAAQDRNVEQESAALRRPQRKSFKMACLVM